MMLRVTLILLIALATGCAKTIDGDYCDIARPVLFDSMATVEWLADRDPAILRRIIAHNETHAAFCAAG
jgi:hypothetical protein